MSWLPSPIPHPLSYFDAPGWCKELLDWVIGMDWPEGDEQATWDVADGWYTASAELQDPLLESERAALDAVIAFGGAEGKVAAAIKDAWLQIGSGSDKSALQAAAFVTHALGEMLEGAGCDIQGAKLEYYVELGLLLIELIAMAVAAFFTFGASTAAAGPMCMATRFAIKEILKRLLKSLIERGIKRAVKDKLKDLGKDFGKKLGKWAIKAGKEGLDEAKEELLTQGGIQAYQNAIGRRHGVDLVDLAVSAGAGFAGGAASTLAGGHNGSFTSKMAHGARAEVLGELGGSAATGQLPGLDNLGMSAVSGARGSATHHVTHEFNAMTDTIVGNLAAIHLDGDAGISAAAGITTTGGSPPNTQPVTVTGDDGAQWPSAPAGGTDGHHGGGSASLAGITPPADTGQAPPGATVTATGAAAPPGGPAIGPVVAAPTGIPAQTGPASGLAAAPATAAPSTGGGSTGGVSTGVSAGASPSTGVSAGTGTSAGLASTTPGTNTSTSTSASTGTPTGPSTGTTSTSASTGTPTGPSTGTTSPTSTSTSTSGSSPATPSSSGSHANGPTAATGPGGTTDAGGHRPATAPHVRPAAPDPTSDGQTTDPAAPPAVVPTPVTVAGGRPDGGTTGTGPDRGGLPDTEARRWSDAYHGGLRAQRRAVLASMGAPGALAAAAWDALNRHRGPEFTTGGVTSDDVSALTGTGTPPPVDASRRYHQRGGYRPVLARHQRELEDAVPRGADGRPRRFPSLSSGWLGLANDGGPQADPSRGVNCVDVVLSVADTWLHGRPRCAAPRTLDGFSAGRPVPSGGEPGGPRRIEDFFGGRLQQLCPNTRGMEPDRAADAVTDAYARLEQQLLAAGPGAMAVIIHQGADGTSHTWPVFNDGGVVMYADPQQPPGEPSTTPPFTDGIRRMDALVVAPDGTPSTIADAPAGAWSQYRPRPGAASTGTPDASAAAATPGAGPLAPATADPAAAGPATVPAADRPTAAPDPDGAAGDRATGDAVPDPAGTGRGPAEPSADVMLRNLTDAELARLGVGAATLADLGYPDPAELSPAQRATLEAMLPQVAVVSTQDVRFTQRSVSPHSGSMSLAEFARQLGETGWRGGPAHVVAWGDGSLTSLDNRRMRAARLGGLDAVPVCVHTPDEPLAALPEGEDPERERYRAPLTTEIRRLPDGTLAVGGDRGEVLYARGAVPATFGQAAMFRAAEQRSLLPGRLFGADAAPVTIGRPPGPLSVDGDVTPDEAQVLRALHDQATAAADSIMGDLSGLADAVSDQLGLADGDRVRLRGTAERVKSLASLTRKFLVEGGAVGIDAFADGVNDAVRFSVQLPGGAAYRQAFDRLRAGLERDGYQLTGLKNFFRPGNRFQGLNATFTSPDGQLFEVQVPTADSFRAWELTHHAYEVMRQASEDDNEQARPDGAGPEVDDLGRGELPPRRVHAFLSMLAVNAQLGLDQGVPPGVADIPGPDGRPVGAVDTGFAKWITKNRRLWARYQAWLDGQGASFDSFADVLAEFGLDAENLPIEPGTAVQLERLDAGLLRVLRGGQIAAAAPGDPDLGRPGRDDVEPSPESLGVRPGGSALAAGQPDVRRPVGGDHQGGGRGADPADHQRDGAPAGRGDHPLDLPVEGRPAAERRLAEPAADDTPPDPAGTAPRHDLMMRGLSDAELARLGAGRATLADLGYADPSELSDAERARLEALLPRIAVVPTADVRVSQRSVSPFSGVKSMAEFAREMGETGWHGGPAHVVVWGDGSLSSLDNRRLRAARLGGLDRVPVCLHTPDEPLGGEKGDTLAVDLRRLDDGTLAVGGDRGEIAYAKGTVPRTYGEAALFRAAWQRSLLPGRLYGADAVHVTITKPPAPVSPDVRLTEQQARVLAAVHTAGQTRAKTALGHLRGILADLNGQRGLAPDAPQALRLQGTQHMVKSLESLQRKFWTEGRQRGAEAFAEEVNDAARFSVQLPGGAAYPTALRQVISGLEGQGHQLVQLKNFFRPGNRYHGLNATFRAPDGGLMEVQFPTADSYRAWQQTHEAYEVVRREDELHPRRIHALLGMYAVNRGLGLNGSVPPGIEQLIRERFPDAPTVQNTSLLRWITQNKQTWPGYRAWLAEQGATFDGFGAVLDEFGLHGADLVMDPDLVREMEGRDDPLLSDLRVRQERRPAPGAVHSGGDRPGRDALGLRPAGVDVRPAVDSGVPLQAGEHGPVRRDQSAGGGSRLPDGQSPGRRVPGRGDHPLDLPVEGGHPGEPGLDGPASELTDDDTPPDPMGRAFEPRPDTGLSAAERAMLDDVHERAVRSSDVILDDLTDIAGDVERRLGLAPGSLEPRDTESRVKSRESLERKYLTEGRLAGPDAFAATVNDAVRFSLVLPGGADYRPALDRFLQGMAAAGYQPDGPPKDFWRPGNRFYGTNATFRAPDGTLFEVQLPTELSYQVWHATHAQYEVLRDDDADPEPRVRALLRMIEINRSTGMIDAIPPGMGGQSKDTGLAKWISDNPAVWNAFVDRLAAQGRTPDDVIAEYDLAPGDFPVTDKVAAVLEGQDAVLPGALSQGRRGLPGPAADGPAHPGRGVPGVDDLGSPGAGVALRPGDGARVPEGLAQRLPAQAGPADGGRAGRPDRHRGDPAAAERAGDRGDLRGVAPQTRGGDPGVAAGADPRTGHGIPEQRGPVDGDVPPPDPAGQPRPAPADPAHPQWSYRAGLQTRLSSYELRRRQQESDSLADRSAWHLNESRRLDAWARHYRAQDPYSSQGAECEYWADQARAWSVEYGNRSRAAYNGTYTEHEVTTVPADQWAHLNTDSGELYADPAPVDGRPYHQVGGLRPPLRAHQDDLAAAMPRQADGSLEPFPDARTGTWFGLANDGGPEFDPSRGINCLDCMVSLWQTWRGNPRVSAPRTWDRYRGTDVTQIDRGEEWGRERAAAVAGRQWETVFPDMSRQLAPDQMRQWSDWGFAALVHQLQAGGHGAAAFLETSWQGGGGHAWLAVNQNGTILFLDSQTRHISENVPMYSHTGDPDRPQNVVELKAIYLDAQGTAQPIAALSQTSWGRQAQQTTAQNGTGEKAADLDLLEPQVEQDQSERSDSEKVYAPDDEALPDPAGRIPDGPAEHTPGSKQKDMDDYVGIRALPDDIERIARNLGVPEEVVARARRNLFLEVHDVADGPGPDYFYRDHYFRAHDFIVNLWTWSYEGKFPSALERETALAMLAHEYIESKIMELTDLPYAPSDPRYWGVDDEGTWQARPTRELFGAHDLAPLLRYEHPFAHYAAASTSTPRT
ncbi:hypothetical protein Cs7R123_22750 [Catellatospora sp. TT07R-123]|uniref:toxin glutamine deamidase domain-containing protein n=1 Tax=Catellatospora sp. TT07R-123 TaxID=2733863 RepID=UPI001B1A1EF7|nr:toxin glutamine deamidase domain-containing protein [Catellatospora sp. TT07R-123]GHJ44933.1 hypothetical protein Cs7R123_22750 [Catellatospora sp. TT07R-123]